MYDALHFSNPIINISFGLIGTGGRLSALVPNGNLKSRFNSSVTLTALHTLSVTSISRLLLSIRLGNFSLIIYI